MSCTIDFITYGAESSGDSIDGSFSTVVVESSTGDTAKASVEYTDVSVSITVDAVVVGNDELDSVISTWAIGQNFPNPFVGRSTVPFSIPENAEVEFRVFDLLGRQVVRRNLGVLLPGRHAAVVNLENESSGVYLFELQAFSAGRRHFRESVGLVVMN